MTRLGLCHVARGLVSLHPEPAVHISVSRSLFPVAVEMDFKHLVF